MTKWLNGKIALAAQASYRFSAQWCLEETPLRETP